MNKYIYGIHEPPPLSWLDANMRHDGQAAGWIVYTHECGHDPSHHAGYDYRSVADKGYGVIARLNNGYSPNGTIPLDPADFDNFALRLNTWVANSEGCNHWIIGNEPNSSVEGSFAPGVYAACFRLCYDAIKAVQPDAVVMPAPVAMWNAEVMDWLIYYGLMLDACYPFDALCWHTYTHGADPALITSMQKMGPPFGDRLFQFRAYWDLWNATFPEHLSGGIYITETDQGDVGGVRNPWLDEPGVHWIREAYQEIDQFNRQHGYPIRCLACYRWPNYDEWHIEGKPHVHEDFAAAVSLGFTWQEEEPPMPEWTEVFNTSMDQGFYDYDEAGELTAPFGSVPLYEHDGTPETDLARPEYDERHEPETHTPPNAAGFFSMFSTMEAALVWEIPVTPGDQVRASCWAMTVNGGGGPACRLGIAVDNPGAGAIEVQGDKFTGELESRAQWGDWQTAEDRVWGHLWSPVVTATRDRVWIVMNGRQDWSNPGHTHWDDLSVEVLGGSPPIPPTGEYRVVVYDPAGNEIASVPFEVASVDSQVCALAQQIVSLTCGGG